MPRREVLLRLYKTLRARRADLRANLTGELASLREFKTADATGDNADLAFAADGDEMSLRLAGLDDRELGQIDGALGRWNQGMYGICEGCQKPISLARLNALPHAPFCINCERKMEKNPNGLDRQSTGNWDQISDAQATMQDQHINLFELARNLTGSRRS